jgi:hypothetical protein
MRLFYSLLIFAAGLGLVVYRERIQLFTGSFAFAEKYLGSTFNFYLLFGIGMMMMSFLYLFGTFDSFLQWTVGRFLLVPQ